MAVEKIVVGRDREDLKKFGSQGTAYIGKHVVGTGEESHLTNPIQMDVTRPHVVLVCGKRGTGKSYSAGVIAEEMVLLPKEIKQNLAAMLVDTMGIYWSMKNPNERGRNALKGWDLKPAGFDTKLFVPVKYVPDYKAIGIEPVPFTLPCGELTAMDWILAFGFSMIDPYGIAIERAIKTTQARHRNAFSIDDVIRSVEADKRSEQKIKDALVNRFLTAKDWGIFEKTGTPIKDIFEAGRLSVIDVSHFMRVSAGWSVRSMLVGLLSRKIFQERLMARKAEEFETMTGEAKKRVPMVWIMIDEAHQFAPNEGETAATEPLLTLIKEGREPGISVLMITQRPGRLHEDALAQSDLIISHRLTSRADIEALRSIMQTYVLEDIQELINDLPRTKGSAIILDDNSERLYMAQVRPRLSWHAGGSPVAMKEKGMFE
jgi:DNA helicase HerA-like ATPase